MAADMRGLISAPPPVTRPDEVGLLGPALGYPITNASGVAISAQAVTPVVPVVGVPSTIASLAGWYKASDFDNVAHGTEVTTWYDSSGFGRGANAIGGAGNRQTVSRNAINGNMTAIGGTALRGLSTAIGVSGLLLTSKSTWTVFGVVQFASSAAGENNCFRLSINAGDVRMGIVSTGPNDFGLTYGNVGNFRTTTALTLAPNWHYFILVNSSNTATVYVDGSTLTWASAPGTVNGTNMTDFSVLDDGNNGPFRGLGAEFGVYNQALSSGDRATLVSYFQARFGLP